MPGPFYFAWTDSAVAFNPSVHNVQDESIYAFEISQEEGDFAKLTLSIRNPRIGLLTSGRKVWGWLSWFNGDTIVPLFYGRLIGIPTSLFEDICSLEFISRPTDYKTQKEVLAESLRVLPFYDPIFINKEQRENPDVVLEGYTALYHTDRFAGGISISDTLIGEDGTLEFSEDEVLRDGLQLSLNNIPLRTVTMKASVPWEQTVNGAVDLTEFIYTNWPNIDEGKRYIQTYSFGGFLSGWPKPEGGTSVGNGWEGAKGLCSIKLIGSAETINFSLSESSTTKFAEGGVMGDLFNDNGDEVTSNSNVSFQCLPGSLEQLKLAARIGPPAGWIVTEADNQSSYDDDDNLTSFSAQQEIKHSFYMLGKMTQTLAITYAHDRGAKEILTFELNANVQSVVTDPGEDDVLALTLDSEKVSDPLDDTVPVENQIIPIGDKQSSTYFGLPRGQQSLEYCIYVARAHLYVRSRVIEITVQVSNIAKALDATLRKNGTIIDPRLPGGVAGGKIIGYRFALDGDNGDFSAEIKLGASVGYIGTENEGEVIAIAGTDAYATDYATGYNELTGQQNVLGSATTPGAFDVGYVVPNIQSNADFLGSLSWHDVVLDFSVEMGPIEQQAGLADLPPVSVPTPPPGQTSQPISVAEANMDASMEAIGKFLEENPTIMHLTLVPLSQDVGTEIPLTVTDLELPQSINLEASEVVS